MFVLVILFHYENKSYYLYVSGILGGLATGIYWNGLAALASFFAILFLLLLKKKISIKTLVSVLSVSTLSLLLFFLIPVIYFWQETIALFGSEALQTSRLVSGNAVFEYFSSLIRLILLIIEPKRYNLLVSSILILVIFNTFYGRLVLKDKKITDFLLYGWIWISFFLLIVVFRGGGLRFFYFLLPLIYFILTFSLGYLCENYKKRKIVFLSSIFLLIFSLLIAFNTTIQLQKTSGQWKEYQKYTKDLKEYLVDKKGRVLTTFDFSWALKDYKKLFIETNSFQEPKSYSELNDNFNKYNVKYILVSERSRIRMSGVDEHGIGSNWYYFWDEILNNEYIHIGDVHNKYYRHNKGIKPTSSEGYKTEIWMKNNNNEESL